MMNKIRHRKHQNTAGTKLHTDVLSIITMLTDPVGFQHQTVSRAAFCVSVNSFSLNATNMASLRSRHSTSGHQRPPTQLLLTTWRPPIPIPHPLLLWHTSPKISTLCQENAKMYFPVWFI